jgi:hypothetical protein
MRSVDLPRFLRGTLSYSRSGCDILRLPSAPVSAYLFVVYRISFVDGFEGFASDEIHSVPIRAHRTSSSQSCSLRLPRFRRRCRRLVLLSDLVEPHLRPHRPVLGKEVASVLEASGPR